MMRALNPNHPRKRAPIAVPQADAIFAGAVLILTVLGLIMAYSTTFFWSQVQEGNPFTLFVRQVAFAVLGVVVFFFFSRLDYGVWRRYAIWVMVGCLVLLVGVLLFGEAKFGARRTFLGGSIQPSELVKMAVIVYAAAWLASRRDQVQSFMNGMVPFGVIVGIVSALVMLQPDLSTTANIVLIALAMFFMAGASWTQLTFVILVSLATFLLMFALWPHATDRVNAFVQMLQDPNSLNVDYHIRQSLITLGGGGIFGSGIGAGGQKFGYLPTPHTDSVVAVLGEEMGLVGLLITLALFVVFAWRGLVVAHKADSPFGSFIAIGVVIWVISQMLMNVLAMLAMIPFTGVPVPFLSVGGSSLVSLLAACGIVVSVSRGSRMMREEGETEESPALVAANGGQSFRASSTVRGRNSRSRAARAYRAPGAAGDDAARSTIVGRDVRIGGRLRKQRKSYKTIVRWRGDGHGT
jgi:cell division protein FtsW